MYRIILLSILAIIALGISCGEKAEQGATEMNATAGQPDQAVAEADSIMQAWLQSPDGRWEFQAIDSVYRPIVDKYPNSTQLHRDYQDLHMRFERRAEAISMYEKRWEDNSDSPMYAYLYGRVIEDNVKSRELFKKATELDPDYYWGWHGLGVNYLTNEPVDTAAGIEALKKAIEADNSKPVPFDLLGDVYKARGEFDAALEYYGLLASTSPDDFSSLEPKIDLLRQMNETEKAGNEIQAFLDENPDNYYGVRAMAEHLMDQGKYAEALPYLHQMTALATNPTGAYYELMVTHTKLDQPDSALAVLTKAMDAGYDDFRPILHDPALAELREHPGFAEAKKKILDRMETAESMRKEMLAEDREERKQEALTEKLDKPAPDFSLVDLHGKTVTMDELEGKPVVLDFWATWCGPCRMTMPLLQKFYEARKDDIHYYAVNVWQEDTTEVRPYLDKYGYEFNNLFGSAETAQKFGVTGIPTLFLIDEQGIIRYQHVGYRQDADEVLSWQLDNVLTD